MRHTELTIVEVARHANIRLIDLETNRPRYSVRKLSNNLHRFIPGGVIANDQFVWGPRLASQALELLFNVFGAVESTECNGESHDNTGDSLTSNLN